MKKLIIIINAKDQNPETENLLVSNLTAGIKASNVSKFAKLAFEVC